MAQFEKYDFKAARAACLPFLRKYLQANNVKIQGEYIVCFWHADSSPSNCRLYDKGENVGREHLYCFRCKAWKTIFDVAMALGLDKKAAFRDVLEFCGFSLNDFLLSDFEQRMRLRAAELQAKVTALDADNKRADLIAKLVDVANFENADLAAMALFGGCGK